MCTIISFQTFLFVFPYLKNIDVRAGIAYNTKDIVWNECLQEQEDKGYTKTKFL